MSFTIQDYLARLQGKRVAVVGIGVSNTPLIKLLLRAGVSVTACDKCSREDLGGKAEELESLGAKLRLGEDYLKGLNHDVIFRTPGLRPDVPEFQAARERGSLITSEMEVFLQVCPCKTIAVTGSDGKTTTTTIIAELLKAAGYTTYLGGNIGRPLLSDAVGMEPGDVAVLELSSFQLMTMTEKSADITVVTNVTPNHLDVHKSMDEYIEAKRNVFAHQDSDGLVVLNQDNEITRSFAAQAPGRVMMFSRKESPAQGAFIKDDAIWVANRAGSRMVLPLSGIKLPGDHNVENYMAAIAAVDGLVPDLVIRAFAAEFGGVEHRIELVRTLNGVRYYNDSIASSPARTIAGLRSFKEQVILIAGGYDKNLDYTEVGEEICKHVKQLFLSGATAQKIRDAVERAPSYDPAKLPITLCDGFREAVLAAHTAAGEGDVVILSPASASFDQFKNFMERGKAFKEIIRGL